MSPLRIAISAALAMAALPIIVACGGPEVRSGDPGWAADRVEPQAPKDLAHDGEVHLADIVQLTRDSGENAEAYWSMDGSQLIFQTTRPPYKCDQIMRVPADGSSEPTLVSTGKGRTTCAYFLPGDQRTVYSSTHLAGDDCPPPPDMRMGYVWAIYDSYEIFSAGPDGGDLVNLSNTPGYDAEATVCPTDGSIIFTSTRNGDLDLYRMDKDGKNVVQLTDTPGYDGGAFFSRDCTKIVWRASRPTGKALEDYTGLLKRGLVRPSKLELFIANADGSDARQVTYLNVASFAPYLHPSNERILFSTNYPDPRGREFDIWAINVDGTGLERITHAPGFDGFPMFSPDGTKLAFASNRNQAKEGETDVYVARWVEGKAETTKATEADRFLDEVRWLADDERQGRGVGTQGLAASADWLEKKMKEAGASGAFGGAFKQELQVPVSVAVGPKTDVTVGRQRFGKDDFVPASFSTSASVRGRTVSVGYGIVAKELGIDDYKGKRVKGKIAVVRRFTPPLKAFADDKVKRRYSDLHHKAFTAREKGAVAVIVVDQPEAPKGGKAPKEADLPPLELARLSEVGIPVVIAKASVGGKLLRSSFPATVSVELVQEKKPAHNVVGVIRAGAKNKLSGAIVIGAHYDHLGMGGHGSLEPDKKAPHNGADDNASGTAALLHVARSLAAQQKSLRRDVYLAAFTAEESGLIGSSHFVRNLPPTLTTKDVVAMLNMDMVGRLRKNTLTVLGGGTAAEWPELVQPACADKRVNCELGGDGYGPSDQTPFYAAGAPVLHFFTGAHGEYHKTTDDSGLINAGGGAQVAAIVADVAARTANREKRPVHKKVAEPLPRGDSRSFGASLGTIPDYANGGKKPGVLLSGVRPGGPADKGGIKGGDRLLKIGKTDVLSVQDMVYVLRKAQPGEKAKVVVERDGKKVTLEVTFGKSMRRRK